MVANDPAFARNLPCLKSHVGTRSFPPPFEVGKHVMLCEPQLLHHCSDFRTKPGEPLYSTM